MTDQRGRTERKTEEATQRRRRNDDSLDAQRSAKLRIPEDVSARLKAEGLTPRWVNDDGARLHDLTVNDDYEKVAGVEPVPVLIDRKKGTIAMAHLLAKRTDFIAEDRAVRDARRRNTEQVMLEGTTEGISPKGENPNPVQGQVYADKANTIGRENRIIE